jgi:hypothetical protein
VIPSISKIDLLTLASGDTLGLQIYKFKGKQKGKKTYIQANLHGAEIVGNAVIARLIEFLSSLDENCLRGEIWLVPVCNPLATNQRGHFFSTGRFNSYDGQNWNRIFWDYEKECEDLEEFARSQLNNEPEIIRKNYLAKIQTAWQKQLEKIDSPSSVSVSKHYRAKLQSLCLDANYVIDIHSSSNQAIEFLFAFKERQEIARYFLLDYAILMNEYDGDAFDEAFLKPWLALEKQLAVLGKEIKFDVESWTLELGSGMQMNPNSVDKGFEGIKNYLVYQKMLDIDTKVISKKIAIVTKDKINSYHAPTGGMIENRLPLNTEVKAGMTIYQLLIFNKQKLIPKTIDIQAETDGIVFDLSTNNCVSQGEYVMDILEYQAN